MEDTKKYLDPDGYELRMMHLFQRVRQLDLGALPPEEIDLTMAQMQVIRFLGENPNCHLQELAEGLGVSSPTASVSISRLEEIGLVTRQPDPDDGRATCLSLTEKSMTVFKQMMKQMFERMQLFLSHLVDKEKDQLLTLMEKAVNGIEQTANQTK